MLYYFQILEGELESQQQEVMNVYTQYHTLPKSLNVAVTLPTMEESIGLINKNQENLVSRCTSLLTVLKERAELWKNFTNRLREVKQSVEEVDFMMDLISVHGSVDYQRLAAATENLQVSYQFYLQITGFYAC